MSIDDQLNRMLRDVDDWRASLEDGRRKNLVEHLRMILSGTIVRVRKMLEAYREVEEEIDGQGGQGSGVRA